MALATCVLNRTSALTSPVILLPGRLLTERLTEGSSFGKNPDQQNKRRRKVDPPQYPAALSSMGIGLYGIETYPSYINPLRALSPSTGAVTTAARRPYMFEA